MKKRKKTTCENKGAVLSFILFFLSFLVRYMVCVCVVFRKERVERKREEEEEEKKSDHRSS